MHLRDSIIYYKPFKYKRMRLTAGLYGSCLEYNAPL